MRASPPFTVTGLVLAGGRGSRLGGTNKGWRDHRGATLSRLAIERLQPQVDEVLISANRNLARYRALGAAVVADDPAHGDFAGPHAGFLAELRAAHCPWLAVVPCDAPAAPRDIVLRLKRGTDNGSPAAVACADGCIQPLFCLLHRDVLSSLQVFLDSGEHKVARWLEQVGAVSVPFDDPRGFANVNTPVALSA